jgi:gliding motility-associated-like protein
MSVSEKNGSSSILCRVASEPAIIDIIPSPIVNAGPDRTLLAGDSISLKGTIIGDAPMISWSPLSFISNEATLTPRVFPPDNQTYTLNAASPNGCTGMDSMKVWIANGLYIPSAFTPNDDGLNDHWRIIGFDPAPGTSLVVYNRYGQEVYKADNGWVDWNGSFNGKPQPSGTYSYRLLLSNGKAPIRGTIQLIR